MDTNGPNGCTAGPRKLAISTEGVIYSHMHTLGLVALDKKSFTGMAHAIHVPKEKLGKQNHNLFPDTQDTVLVFLISNNSGTHRRYSKPQYSYNLCHSE